MRHLMLAAALFAAAPALASDALVLAPQNLPEWKAVYGRVVARDLVPARARIGGTVIELFVTEGDEVMAGERIAVVRDDKIAFQVAAFDAQLRALAARLETAEAELARGSSLLERGIVTRQRLEQLRTDVEVTRNQIAETEAQRSVVVQQGEEGEVLAPLSGRVLTVPVTKGAVVLAGEPIATLGGGGFFLQLAIPERHWRDLKENATIRIVSNEGETEGRLARIYPQIENGRVLADVEVDRLENSFVDARILVEVPVGAREVLLVPKAAIATRSGLDFVQVQSGPEIIERAVVPGDHITRDGVVHVEILSGLFAGETIIVP